MIITMVCCSKKGASIMMMKNRNHDEFKDKFERIVCSLIK